MSIYTEQALKTAPPADAGISLSSAGGTSFGGWTEIVASMSATSALAGFEYVPGQISTTELQFGVGSAGNEVDIGSIPIVIENSANIDNCIIMLPVPISGIASGQRLSARLRSITGGTVTCTLAVMYYENFDSDHAVPYTSPYTYSPYGSTATITPDATPWDDSAWVELNSGFAEAGVLLGVAPNWVGTHDQYEIDLGVGAAGLETVITTFRGATASLIGFSNTWLPRPYPIDAGVRVAARLRKSDTSTNNISIVLMHIGPLSVIPSDEIELPETDAAIGLTWVEFTDADADTHVSSKIALPDPADYYHGYKEDRVLEWGLLVRALSDYRTGTFQGIDFEWTWNDKDRWARELLYGETTKYFLNRPVTVRMIDDESRRALLTPRTVMRGVVSSYKPEPGLTFRMAAQDVLTRALDSQSEASIMPYRRITRTDFENAPSESLDLGVPILYGDITRNMGPSAGGADPVEGVSVALNASALAAPTSFAASLTSGGEDGIISGRPNFYQLSAFVDGVESARASVTVTNTASQPVIQLTWNAYAGADALRLYWSHRSDFAQFHYITTTDFWTPPGTSLAAGATSYDDEAVGLDHHNHYTRSAWLIGRRLRLTYYVYALVSEGVYSLPGEASIEIMPIIRNDRGVVSRSVTLTWSAYSGALGFRIVRNRGYYHWEGEFDYQWDVAADVTTLTDDGFQFDDETATSVPGSEDDGSSIARPITGQIPLINVGQTTIASEPWTGFLVAGHACKGIGRVDYSLDITGGEVTDSGFQRVPDADFGDHWLVPGYAGWPYGNDYIDINGRRYTVIYTNIDPPPTTVLADVQGIEAVGNGSGALITSVVEQYKHALVNWVFQSYQSGSWLSTPVFADGENVALIDEDSFTAADAVLAARISGGYVGAGGIGIGGQTISVRDVIQWFNQSCDVDSGFSRKCQFLVSAIDDSVDSESFTTITDLNDVMRATFEVEDDLTALYNVIPYGFARYYPGVAGIGFLAGQTVSEWNGEGELSDATSITNHAAEIKMERLRLEFIRSGIVAADIAGRKLLRHKDPPRIIRFKRLMPGFNNELGDILNVAHHEAPWPIGEARPVRIIKHEGDPNDMTVLMEALDMSALFFGSFLLGDETSLPATYTSATVAQRRRYGYLASDTTGQFSNSEAGKRLR